MKTKLTLRMEEALVEQAKTEARKRGKSVSGMVAEYFRSLKAHPQSPAQPLPPLTDSLAGVAKDQVLSIEDYKTHLRDKHR
jgi:hypothetical protein